MSSTQHGQGWHLQVMQQSAALLVHALQARLDVAVAPRQPGLLLGQQLGSSLRPCTLSVNSLTLFEYLLQPGQHSPQHTSHPARRPDPVLLASVAGLQLA